MMILMIQSAHGTWCLKAASSSCPIPSQPSISANTLGCTVVMMAMVVMMMVMVVMI